MNKLKEHLQLIIAAAAVFALVTSGVTYFAKASDVRLVELRLDQKIVGDQLLYVQQQIRQLEEKYKCDMDFTKWHEADRIRYKELKAQEIQLQKKYDIFIQKGL